MQPPCCSVGVSSYWGAGWTTADSSPPAVHPTSSSHASRNASGVARTTSLPSSRDHALVGILCNLRGGHTSGAIRECLFPLRRFPRHIHDASTRSTRSSFPSWRDRQLSVRTRVLRNQPMRCSVDVLPLRAPRWTTRPRQSGTADRRIFRGRRLNRYCSISSTAPRRPAATTWTAAATSVRLDAMRQAAVLLRSRRRGDGRRTCELPARWVPGRSAKPEKRWICGTKQQSKSFPTAFRDGNGNSNGE